MNKIGRPHIPTDGRQMTDAGVTCILLAHPLTFDSSELQRKNIYFREKKRKKTTTQLCQSWTPSEKLSGTEHDNFKSGRALHVLIISNLVNSCNYKDSNFQEGW